MIKLEYWNSYNIMGVSYESGYKNRVWLDVDVKKPTYDIDREAYENGIGESMNISIKWTKQYTFEIFCLEPLVDALTCITLHDNVWVTLDNGYSGQVKDFLCDVAWTEIDNLAKVKVTMVVKSLMVNGSMAAGCNS